MDTISQDDPYLKPSQNTTLYIEHEILKKLASFNKSRCSNIYNIAIFEDHFNKSIFAHL